MGIMKLCCEIVALLGFTQPRFMFSYRYFRTNLGLIMCQGVKVHECMRIENGTVKLSRNVGSQQPI
jgi:hypothetical protein